METILEKQKENIEGRTQPSADRNDLVSLSSLQRPLGSRVRDRSPWCTGRWREDMPMRAVR